MRNVIAFTVYGDDPLYREGLLAQARLRDTFYPGWEIVVYSDRREPRLEWAPGVVQLDPPEGIENPMAWRLAAGDLDADRVIFRDADSRFGAREAAAVAAWIDSGLPFHVMRDHRHHFHWMLGGMWGLSRAASVRGHLVGLLRGWQGKHRGRTEYGADEAFLADVIWPVAQREGVLQHDSAGLFWGSAPFPIARSPGGPFVGEKIGVGGDPAQPVLRTR